MQKMFDICISPASAASEEKRFDEGTRVGMAERNGVGIESRLGSVFAWQSYKHGRLERNKKFSASRAAQPKSASALLARRVPKARE